MIFFEIFYKEILISANTSAVLTLLIVMTKRWHGHLSNDTSDGPQKFHSVLTPRVGGIAIFIGLIVGWMFAPQPLSQLLGPILIAGLPVFVTGVIEDISKTVSPSKRLLAALVTGIAAWILTGYTINHIEISWIDFVFAYLPLSILFTAFAVAGVTNAINIIDGFNGLAGGTLMICFAAMGYIAWQVGDHQIAQLCMTLFFVLNGFLMFNYPFGKIFMGDGGAYLLGFILSWVSVMISMRNSQVSVWAPLLICCYPVNEAVYSMGRRFWNKTNLDGADSMHLHSLIKIRLIRPKFGHLPPYMKNSMVAPLLWLYVLLFALLAIALYDRHELLMIAYACSFALYSLIYWLISRIKVDQPNSSSNLTPKQPKL